ncbi:MAG TPA: universal stress protein [Gemmatimonadales bacterium]|nr:universal stress protein [Gemmatimonadales bacterium]
MELQRIVVAADESEASRQGIRTALAWGSALAAPVTLYHVVSRTPAAALVPVGGPESKRSCAGDALGALEAWVTAELADQPDRVAPAVETGYGLPGVEIPRFAERLGAELLVLGRKPRSNAQRMFQGDTADAVARRSTVPCLFVRKPLLAPARMLVAVDGTERGMTVLEFARSVAARLNTTLSGVIVERSFAGEAASLATSVPAARTAALQRRVNGALRPLLVRRGDAAAEILQAAEEVGAEVIVIGYRRGGPPGVIEAGSVARYVSHHARCAVLTVPL